MTGRTSQVAARVFLAALFAVCLYRAITQSITHDEALTYKFYIVGPVSDIFHRFDPCHHFLNTVLMRLSTGLFGVSELSMRLPALAGAALYFTAVYRLSRAVFGTGRLFLLAVFLLSLNPFVLDFMVAARGYGLALALWTWALMLLIEGSSRGAPAPKELMTAGAALALSVTANLIFAVPAAALAGIAVYLFEKRPRSPAPKKRSARKAERPAWLWFIAPMGGIALLYLVLAPVENMKTEQFFVGAATISASLRSLASVSLAHSGVLRSQSWADALRDAVAFGIAPLIVMGGLVAGVLRRNVPLLMAAGTIVLSAVAILLLHLVSGRPYPADRTGIYFLPLVALVLVGLARSEKLKVVPVTVAVLFVVAFLTEFNTRKFLLWEYDADTRSIAESISSHRAPAASLVRIAGSWDLQESIAFYGYMHRWTWMELTREKTAPGFDFYALVPWDRDAIDTLGLTEIYRGPVSGSVLATSEKSPRTDSPPLPQHR